MSVLNLFPSRVPIGNDSAGNPVYASPELLRAFNILFNRVGGALGDNGVDVFADTSNLDALDMTRMDAVMQPSSTEAQAMDAVMQAASNDAMQFADVMQPTGGNTSDRMVVKAGTAAAPSITTEGDENTGIYFPAADKMAVTTGGVERMRFGSSGDVAMAASKKFFFDGVDESGDTYLIESAANVVDLYVGGVKALTVTTTGTTLAGHPILEGVTATGATGTGNLVFDNSPTLITPNLGTPSALVGTNISGTAAGLTAGALVAGSGVTASATPPISITVVNGLVTALT